MRKGCDRTREIAILPQVLEIEPRFVRKDSRDAFKTSILLEVLAIELHFVRKGCVSCRLVRTVPRLKGEIEKKEGARGQEGKRECKM